MKFARTASLCVLIAGAGVIWATPRASAQSQWVGNSPVFQSDIERRQRQLEAERAERRKTYNVVYPRYMDGGERPEIKPKAPPIVYLEKNEKPGTIIVDTGGRQLYYVLPGNRAYAYPISVGRDGFTWTGTERVSRIASWPSWTPPPEMRRRQPGLPITVSGGLLNPLGAKALYLGNTIYRIHGTNNERSIGRASSSGCFRMMNEHVVHLASLARVGTVVRVVANYSGVSTSPPLSALFSGLGFGFGEEVSSKKSRTN
ncbi:MAG TPA: L,D-transpeptidase [Hyphomicrobiaceae bacterium]|jgi:lipoprotein-anchoring transpeptidase ErfK/SrfK